MIDVLLMFATFAFFVLSWGYVRFCEKLRLGADRPVPRSPVGASGNSRP